MIQSFKLDKAIYPNLLKVAVNININPEGHNAEKTLFDSLKHAI